MNFVQLVEKLRVECGVSGSPLMSVSSVGGELLRLRNWINDAWEELQTVRTDWQFMRGSFEFHTTPNIDTYSVAATGVTRMDNWKRDSFFIYQNDLGVSNQQPLGEMGWDWFRDMYKKGTPQFQRPMAFSVMPDKSLIFGPVPETDYDISGEYYKTVQTLTADADVPEMPPQFHRLIVYEAMLKYADYENAPEVMARGKREGGRLRNMLEFDQLPKVTVAGGFDGCEY